MKTNKIKNKSKTKKKKVIDKKSPKREYNLTMPYDYFRWTALNKFGYLK